MRLSFVAALVFGSSVLFGCAVDRSGRRPLDAALPDGGHALDAQPPGDAGDAGAPPDGGPPPPDGGGGLCGWPYDPVYFDPCASPGDEVEEMLSDDTGEYRYDTEDGRLRQPDGSTGIPPTTVVDGVRVWWAQSLVLGAGVRLRVLGPRPLLIAATGDITIEGTIDASSFYDELAGEVHEGAGANPAACAAMAATQGTTCIQHAGSGGGGGGFGARGGDGGDVTNRGCDTVSGDVPGGEGGSALLGLPTTLRGGCSGADGAANRDNDGMTGRGIGGAGGGAVQLSAAGRLVISGTLHVGGAGGSGAFDATGGSLGGKRGGGGGGGSGGMIGLESQDILVEGSALVVANGGGGGGGTDTSTAGRGEDGPALIDFAAGGEAPDGSATAGGDGGWRTQPSGSSAAPTDNGRGTGGGGGAVGFVVIYAHGSTPTAPLGQFSPGPDTVSP